MNQDPEFQAEVQRQKTALLYRNAGLAQAVNVLSGGLFALVNANLQTAQQMAALLWWLLICGIAGGRYLLARRFVATTPDAAAAPRWRQRYIVATALAGVTWGFGAAWFMWNAPDVVRLFGCVILAGMVAGAVPVLASVPAAFRVFALTVVLPITLTLFLQAQSVLHWALGLTLVVFLGGVLASARYLQEVLEASILLSIEKAHMVDTLERAHAAAEAANVAKGRFLATMSHEIRTPMNGMLGMAQLLLLPDLTDTERQQYARTIFDSGQSLLAILNDILDYAKVEAGSFDLSPAAFDPRLLLEETAALHAPTAQAKGLVFESAWHGPAGQVFRADPVRLRQMLSNLISNAVKFTARGSVRVEGRVASPTARGVLLEFVVTDTGIGMAAEQLPLLFRPFSQLDASNTRAYGGTGLGLSIVRSLAELMHGDVSVESTPGTGSRFTVTIEAEPVDDLPDTAPQDADPHLAQGPGTSGAHVLVVEDHPVNRKFVCDLLHKSNVSVRTAENGQQAVDALLQEPRPGLVLMDCQMPVMDGYEATRRIRAWETANHVPHVPIIAVTAGAFADDRERCLSSGMNDYLAKPVNANALAAALARWMPEAGAAGAAPAPGPAKP